MRMVVGDEVDGSRVGYEVGKGGVGWVSCQHHCVLCGRKVTDRSRRLKLKLKSSICLPIHNRSLRVILASRKPEANGLSEVVVDGGI